MPVAPALRSEGYFYEIVTTALGRTQVDTSEHTEFYLVGLLDSYTQTALPSGPLALKLLGGPPERRILALKEVGDTALFVSGFFPESLERTLVSESYYVGVGRVAYRELSSRVTQSALSDVFDELSAEFKRFVTVLAEARTMVQL